MWRSWSNTLLERDLGALRPARERAALLGGACGTNVLRAVVAVVPRYAWVAMNGRTLSVGLLVGLLVSVAAPALADIAPPPGYVEKCTVRKQQADDEVCESCDAWHGDSSKCSTKYKGTKLQKRCQTSGASTWTEVWCRKATAKELAARPAPTVQPIQKTGLSGSSCHVADGPSGAAGPLWGGLVLLLLGLRRRRGGR